MQSLGPFNPRSQSKHWERQVLQLFIDIIQQQAIIAFGYKDSVGIEQLNQMSFSETNCNLDKTLAPIPNYVLLYPSCHPGEHLY